MAFRLLWAVTAQTCLASDDLDGFEQPSCVHGFLPSEEGRGSGEDVPLLHALRVSGGCGHCCLAHLDEGSSRTVLSLRPTLSSLEGGHYAQPPLKGGP